MNRYFTRSLLAVAVVAASSAAQAIDISGSVGATSDYLFDGISQTDNGGAVQAGINFDTDSGIYFGAWGSNVDFGSDSDLESDWYAGWSGGSEIASFDAGVVLYKYLPTGDDIDYNELYFGVTLFENATFKLWHASDYVNAGYTSDRLKFTYSVAINDMLSIPLEFTHTKFGEEWLPDGDSGVTDTYNHFKVGLGVTVSDFYFEGSYQQTDIDVPSGSGDAADLVSADGSFVFSATYDFGGE